MGVSDNDNEFDHEMDVIVVHGCARRKDVNSEYKFEFVCGECQFSGDLSVCKDFRGTQPPGIVMVRYTRHYEFIEDEWDELD